ncbi:MAG: hypothetical protein AAFW81_10655 [Pseudomonadota bacterium]
MTMTLGFIIFKAIAFGGVVVAFCVYEIVKTDRALKQSQSDEESTGENVSSAPGVAS